MRQLSQSLRTGDVEVLDVPCPLARSGHLVVRTSRSLISPGTERMLVNFGKANLIQKARQQPEKVREALDKIRTDGIASTFRAVQAKLDQPLPLGYCNVGTVVEVGAGVAGFQIGDRVVSNGPHAEMVVVPQNLCAKIPEHVTDEAAVLAVIGAVGLQGIRLAAPSLGETFVVSGLGLIGLMTVQLLRAHGCRVLGLDFDAAKLELARRLGATVFDLSGGDPAAAACDLTRGRGVDGVLITASTASNEPIHQAAAMCRKRGRIVLVGTVGLTLSRADFYEKELSFQVSCSYGPGRYDPTYEERGIDYPLGWVRWTSQRNMEAVLDMMSDGRLNTELLITHRFGFDRAAEAYQLLTSGQSSLGVVLEFSASGGPEQFLRRSLVSIVDHAGWRGTANQPRSEAGPASAKGRRLYPAGRKSRAMEEGERVALSFIGAGNFASQVLIPAFQSAGARLRHVASRSGLTALHSARKFDFLAATTDVKEVLSDPEVTAVVIATRHNTHAQLVQDAWRAGKHVFVEKPLALNAAELEQIEQLHAELVQRHFCPLLMVGFNRRFSPHVQQMVKLIRPLAGPKSFVVTVNAGAVPDHHWVHDLAVGGGRIVGEACHFVDLLRMLCGHPITGVQSSRPAGAEATVRSGDHVTFTLSFADGSIGTVHYLPNGHRSFPKERVEVFCAGRVLQLDNFRKLRGFGWPSFKRLNLWRQDKGHRAGAKAFLDAVRQSGPAPIPFEELIEVTRATFDILPAAKIDEQVPCRGSERLRGAA